MAEDNQEVEIFRRQTGHAPRRNVKKMWPEVVGETLEEAERIIKEEKPGVEIQVIRPLQVWFCDYRVQRVRKHVDSSGKVCEPPTIG